MIWVHRLRRSAALGFVVWALAVGSGALVERPEQLIALAPLVAVPLGFALALGDDEPTVLERVAAAAVLLGGPCAAVSLTRGRGAGTAALVVPWLVATLLVAVAGAQRFWSRRTLRPVCELAVDAGLVYLPVGAVWLLAARAGHGLLGFHEPIVTFTAAHFHYAGFAAPLVAGVLGRALRPGAGEPASPLRQRVYEASAVVVILGVPLVAAGIQLSHTLEMPAAVLLSAGMLGCATLLARTGMARLLRGPGAAVRASGALLIASGLSLVFSMLLATLFAATGSATRGASEPLIPYSQMAELHGTANALGFAFLALVGWTLAPPGR